MAKNQAESMSDQNHQQPDMGAKKTTQARIEDQDDNQIKTGIDPKIDSEKPFKYSEPTGRLGEIILRLMPVGLLLGGLSYWAIVGKIPTPVQGRAVILIPRSIVNIEPRQGGRVLTLLIQPGDSVKKGQLLATLEFPELETELKDKKDRLADLKQQDKRVDSIEVSRRQLNAASIDRQQKANQLQIKALQVQLSSNQKQREAYLSHARYLKNFQNSTDERLAAYDKLIEEGAVAKLDFPSYLFQFNNLEASNSINRVQIELDRLKGVDESLRAQMNALTAQNNILNTEKRQIDLQDTASDILRYNAIADQQREINTLRTTIQANKNVVSLYNGQILDLSVNPGEVLAPGGRIGTLEVSNLKAKTNVVALFKSGDAKRLEPGKEVEVVPDLYDRERYGGIVAKVITVDQQPVTVAELANIVGSHELASKLFLGRDEDDRDKPIPVNASVIKATLALKVDRNTPSGFYWTQAKGAPQTITNGTTADVHAVVEERSLVSYITPAFRWITGVYDR
ncbi:NHLP bacteriocin system secretion protein [Microcystis aeruginosa NIES-298]|uniref:Secretion protein HlyD family protein n=1 Tax=Microcystis aeruginosa NIES-298 TaxID=449468 RepID=A0A2H6BRD0_MICAE|nr:NHLP bacteriocin system secretion protein [Microcystis aeruginosa]QHU85428.1 NHLP bacteriocin system secretion protein [Microcystis aeruginosa NIES-298]GBD52710.1 secretion protein HlyD family protein [Microcystis aeruginosa NIES-298]GBE97871.1 NHLP bacteriocin system secretion protein [Microcystis aeruginosa NIES-298]